MFMAFEIILSFPGEEERDRNMKNAVENGVVLLNLSFFRKVKKKHRDKLLNRFDISKTHKHGKSRNSRGKKLDAASKSRIKKIPKRFIPRIFSSNNKIHNINFSSSYAFPRYQLLVTFTSPHPINKANLNVPISLLWSI
jgi:hypothetical protein